MALIKIARVPIDLLLPPRCGGCRAVVERDDVLCPTCWAGLDRIAGDFCACCGVPFATPMPPETLCGKCLADKPAFDRARAVFGYDGAGRDLVLGLKHADRGHLARMIGGWMVPMLRDIIRDTPADQPILLVPVPLHWSRLWRRQYNQALFLARSLQKRAGDHRVRVRDDLVIRHRATAPQGSKGAPDRASNVKNAFRIGETAPIKKSHLIVIDDVMTTGSTVHELARLLRRHGASRIDVITAARVGHE